MRRRKLVCESILKEMADYSIGSTMAQILYEIGATTVVWGSPVKAARQWAYHVIVDEKILGRPKRGRRTR